MQDNLIDWFKSFVPAPLNAAPRLWLRAAIGIAFVMPLVFLSDRWLVGTGLALQVIAPVGASAVLVFVASSSPFAQPWSVIGGNLFAALIGVSLGLSGLPSVLAATLAGAATLLCLFSLRCLHPPSIALALVAAVGSPDLHQLHFGLLGPVMFNSLLLVTFALLFNNLTGNPYPKARLPRENEHHTRDPRPGERMSFVQDDVDRALAEFGEYVDITRDDLARLIKQTEKHALRRSMGEVTAAHVMSRDIYWHTPDTFIESAWQTLQQHRLRSLPVVEGDDHRLVGIVTQIDLLKHFHPRPGRLSFGQLNFLRGTKLRAIMSSPVVSVTMDTHMVELVYLLSDRGLHCLPVVDEQQRLVGMITQTDLIAALYRNWLKQLPD
ncbi:HPP family protein [Stutzerimonas balearica]|jgi:CBS domain-containing membrane protein|uniref:HPP family protein n=1 Tax=Stutzerimonas TaxID=2901164 RepID=UPI0005977683|nr:HPP family protein [Stutzerimonas balearica]KIL03768.1 CBS domain-containing protein [Stutzerimonas stutzeri]QII99799.1 CBS domain-containing protein [Stutzerimonas balearica]WAN09089.1 HPP family protein [Stutzerimonas balearica]